MIVAFFESIKYVGHLFPVAIFRFYIGVKVLKRALERVNGEYLVEPRLAGHINEWLPRSDAPMWYQNLLEQIVVPNWQVFAYLVTYLEFIIALSFIIGFAIRPIGLLACLLTINFIYNSSPEVVELHQIYFAVFFTMAWLGAGRCMGIDYFFFKRRRGIWW